MEISCSLREESKGKNVHVGNEETKYNGHTNKIESIEPVETMTSLMIEVHICKADNERMSRAQKQQNSLRTQVMQNLNLLQRQM